MYHDSTEHPVEASSGNTIQVIIIVIDVCIDIGPTVMVATARCVPNTNVVLVPGYPEKCNFNFIYF